MAAASPDSNENVTPERTVSGPRGVGYSLLTLATSSLPTHATPPATPPRTPPHHRRRDAARTGPRPPHLPAAPPHPPPPPGPATEPNPPPGDTEGPPPTARRPPARPGKFWETPPGGG